MIDFICIHYYFKIKNNFVHTTKPKSKNLKILLLKIENQNKQENSLEEKLTRDIFLYREKP